MSLMNDALRKKKREGTSVSPPPGFAAEGRRPWNARWWGLAGALLVMGAVLGGIYLQAGSDRGLLLIDPASARPLPPAADGAAPSAPDASPQATVTHRPLTGEEAPAASPVTSAGTSPASKPAGLTPAVEAAPPGDRPPRVLPEATQDSFVKKKRAPASTQCGSSHWMN